MIYAGVPPERLNVTDALVDPKQLTFVALSITNNALGSDKTIES